MSRTSVRWLISIVAIEVAGILALLVWVLAIGPAKQADAPAPSSQSSAATALKPPELTAITFATGLAEPTDITAAPQNSTDKRLFVVQQNGIIRTLNAEGALDAAPFLDISAKVLNSGEMGLLGFTFHTKYAENGFVYVNYVTKDMYTIVARYTVSPQTAIADPATEKVVLRLKQPYSNHNGGALAFGPDGYLYVGLGDGGSGGDPENRAQNKNELLGKILRLNVDTDQAYTVPAANPFVGQSGAKGEIWASGLRNPWKISFDRKTGDLYIADVGQGKIEEANMQPKASKGGENYGWRCYEGTKAYVTTGCQPANAYVPPIFEYDHSEGRCSVTGGYVYRGAAEKALLGKYFYADYCSGHLYYAEQKDGAWSQTLALKTSFAISTFGEDQQGELYFGDHATGTIYRLEDTAN
jgi:glucose/arabinose dehydrogenase